MEKIFPVKYFVTLFLALGLFLSSKGNLLPVFFSNITIENGLSSNVTNSIVQDCNGFIWIGTQEGLCRFDGYKIINFQNNNTQNSIPSNNISSLLVDGKDIWVGTWDGLCIINAETFKVSRINTGNNRVIRALHKDKHGRILIGTSKGLLIFNKQNDEFKYFNSLNSSLTHNTIRCFYEATNGDIWIGTYNGLNKFKDGSFTGYYIKGKYKPLLENNLICTISPGSQGNDTVIWVGTETGLVKFNTVTGAFKLYNSLNTQVSNEVVKCIYPQNDSVLWLGTDFGLNLFNTRTLETVTLYHDPLIDNTVASNVIWEIFEDDHQRLWLITSGGVSIVDNSRQYHRMQEEYYSFNNPRIGNQIKDILVDRNGDIWMATIHGVFKKNRSTGERKSFSTSSPQHERILLDNIYALEEDINGHIWIGTAGGINIWDPELKIMRSVTANRYNGLISNYISGFARQNDGTFWVSAWEGGMFRVDRSNANDENMRFIMIDKDGDGRFITTQKGVYYAGRNKLFQVDVEKLEKKVVGSVNKALGNKDITGMYAGKNGDLWIGAENVILRYFPDADSVAKVNINVGRSQKLINLQEDNRGFLWATSQNAIVKVDISTYGYFTLPVNTNSPLNGFYHYCNAILPDGKILFGGDNGFVEVDPGLTINSETKPKVLLSGFFINNELVLPSDSVQIIKKDIAFTHRLKLKHYQNSFSFEFSTLDFLFPEITQFTYRLLPQDEVWQLTSGAKNFAVFSNVKPGNYTFEVKGTNHLGVWSDVYALEISISPPIWLSNGFLIMYIFLALALTYFVFRIYSYRQRLKNELEIVKLENLHKESLYQAKIHFFTNISHEFRTPLSLILPPIQELLKTPGLEGTYQRMLKIAGRNAERLYKLINQLLDFRKIETSRLELSITKTDVVRVCKEVFASFDDMASRHEIKYVFNSSLNEIIADIDNEKIETIVFNLLSNAFKYTPFGGSINMDISVVDDKNDLSKRILLKITDSGIGISKKDLPHIFEQFYQTNAGKSLKIGSGIGLTLSSEYAKIHNGDLWAESKPGNGSTFYLSVPLFNQSSVSPSGFISNFELGASSKAINHISLPKTAKRLLVIDDNDDILEFIELNTKNNYHVYCAKNGKEGIELFEKVRPHMVISDIMMPVMDGFEVCERIKNNKLTAHIPAILLTAKSLDTHKNEGLAKGADLYITKPFDIEYLRKSIAGIFKRDEQLAGYVKSELLLNPRENQEPVKSNDELFVQKVMALIENNLSNPSLSVELISMDLGLSSTHLYRKLKEITGHSTKDIILNYRLQKAAKMIENKTGNITEIMYAVGFSSLSSFSKSFKTKFGVPPSVFGPPLK